MCVEQCPPARPFVGKDGEVCQAEDPDVILQKERQKRTIIIAATVIPLLAALVLFAACCCAAVAAPAVGHDRSGGSTARPG